MIFIALIKFRRKAKDVAEFGKKAHAESTRRRKDTWQLLDTWEI